MIVYKKNFVTRGEVWFDENPARMPVDVLEYYHRTAPVAGCRSVDFFTILIDLARSEEELFAAVRPEARRQIRRAQESGELAYAAYYPDTTAILPGFFEAYEELARAKNLPALNAALIEQYARERLLDVSVVSAGGARLTWHANFRTPSRARQLHSIAFFRGDKNERNKVGRAHRFHTWNDILRFKREGVAVFDLGGWYHGKKDAELLRINAFKEEFGGSIVRNYICERGVTLKGKAYVAARNLMKAGMFNSLEPADGAAVAAEAAEEKL